MANYSESKGTIVVRAKSKETLENFIYLHVLINKDILCFTHFDIFEDLYVNRKELEKWQQTHILDILKMTQ